MAMVDAAFNHPLVLSAESVAVDPIAVMQTLPAAEVPDDDLGRKRLCSARNDSWPSEPETGVEDSKPQANKGRPSAALSGTGQCSLSAVCFVAAYATDVTGFRDA